jgi:hypothetical protein
MPVSNEGSAPTAISNAHRQVLEQFQATRAGKSAKQMHYGLKQAIPYQQGFEQMVRIWVLCILKSMLLLAGVGFAFEH